MDILTLASDASGVELNTPLQTVQLRRGGGFES